jgi:hypothetical protein
VLLSEGWFLPSSPLEKKRRMKKENFLINILTYLKKETLTYILDPWFNFHMGMKIV